MVLDNNFDQKTKVKHQSIVEEQGDLYRNLQRRLKLVVTPSWFLEYIMNESEVLLSNPKLLSSFCKVMLLLDIIPEGMMTKFETTDDILYTWSNLDTEVRAELDEKILSFNVKKIPQESFDKIRKIIDSEIKAHHSEVITCIYASAMYKWVKQVVEYDNLSNELDKLGIKQIEEKMKRKKYRKQLIERVLREKENIFKQLHHHHA